MKALLVWGAGYSRHAAAGASTGDVELLRKLGGVVWFVALWTAANWAVASTTYMSAASQVARIALASAAALAGMGFVLLFDRTMLHVLDTRFGRQVSVTWLLFRITVVLAVGMLTTEKIFPIVMRSELQQQALIDREASDNNRARELADRFQLPELIRRVDGAQAELRRVENQSNAIPGSIQAALARAADCRRGVASERVRLIRLGLGRRQANARVATRAAACARAGREANMALASFRSEMAERLRQVRGRATSASAAEDSASTAVDQRLAEARAIETDAIVATSSTVLGRMILNNPAAALTAVVILVIMLSIELLPFIIKAFAGRTALGIRFSAEREIDSLEPIMRLRSKEGEVEVAIATSREMARSMVAALNSEEVQLIMRQQAVELARQVAPLEGAIRTLRETSEHKRELDSIVGRMPELASLAYSLWTQAIRKMGGPFTA